MCQDICVEQSLPDLAALLPSWKLALKAERKTPGTVKNYTDGVSAFLKWCRSTETVPELTRTKVQSFISDMLDAGAEGTTARSRQLALKRFAFWLVEEGEMATDELAGLRPPRLDRKVVPALTDDELKRLIKACRGSSFKDRRDEALVRLMAETGLRASEVLAVQMGDVDLGNGLVTVRRGKGGKGRVVPISTQATAAMDRYMRGRRHHRLAGTAPLWVGAGGKTLGYYGLRVSLRDRAVAAGITGFHLHLLRHTFATRWLRAKGSESGLMAVAGWTTRDMIQRYTGASASERAAAEARGLNLGDL